MKRVLSVALAALLAVFLLTGCQKQQPKPSDTIARFQRGYSEGDMEIMLDCIDPSIAGSVRSGLSLLGGIMEIDLLSVMGLMPLAKLYADAQGVYPSMRLEVIDEQIDGDQATVSCQMDASTSEESISEVVYIGLFLEDGRWYIESVWQ